MEISGDIESSSCADGERRMLVGETKNSLCAVLQSVGSEKRKELFFFLPTPSIHLPTPPPSFFLNNEKQSCSIWNMFDSL